MNKCLTCGGIGWIIFEKDAEQFYGKPARGQLIEFARRCPDCNGGQAIVEQTKKRAQLPASMYDVEYKDFDWSIYEDDQGHKINLAKQQQLVELFISDFHEWQKEGVGLYIWSKTKGSGKTFLASAICNTLIKEYRIRPKFISVADLIALEKTASTDKYAGRYDKDPILELIDCDVLVLDDLGQSNVGGAWLEDILFRIFDSRMQNSAVTIVTSNKKIDQHDIDDRISDRMNGTLQPIPLPDFRVRSRMSATKKRELLTRIGFLRPREEKQQEQIKLGDLVNGKGKNQSNNQATV